MRTSDQKLRDAAPIIAELTRCFETIEYNQSNGSPSATREDSLNRAINDASRLFSDLKAILA